MPLLLSTEAGDRGKRPRRHTEAGAGTEWAGGRAARGGRDGWPRHATARRAGTGGDNQVRGREWVLLPILYFCVASEPRPRMRHMDGASIGGIFFASTVIF
jgi:hypothetical protein